MKRFLFLTFVYGIVTLNAQSPFTIYNEDNSDLPVNQVNKIVVDDLNNKWVGTENGLIKIDASGVWTLIDTANSDIPANEIRSIYVIDEEHYFVGTYLNGLGYYNAGVWTNYTPDNSPLADYHIKAINMTSADTIWIGTPSGLIKWDGADYWFVYNTANSLLHSPNIIDVYVDENDDVFIGTLNGGLSTYIDGFIDYYRTDNSLISDNTVMSIAEDDLHNKWLATSFGGLSVFTPDATFLKFTPLTSNISDWSVDAVAIDENNVGLLAMASTGLNIFDNTDWTILTTENSDLPDDYVNTVIADNELLVWLGTDTGGLVVLNRDLIDGIQQSAAISIQVYPNPATDNCIFSGNFNEGEIRMYTLSGVLVHTQKIKSNTNFIQVSDFISGNYIIQFTNDEGAATIPLSIIH